MASKGTVDYAATFGKAAIEFGELARKNWNDAVWQPLGIKDRTATQRANANGEGGTRSAMLACMAQGFTDVAMATRAAAYIRNRYLGNASTGNGGITYSWFATSVNMASVASNAVFSADSKGMWRMVAKPRAKATVAPKVRKATVAADSVNGPVTVTRAADAATVAGQ